jgi:hypothetical protein
MTARIAAGAARSASLRDCLIPERLKERQEVHTSSSQVHDHNTPGQPVPTPKSRMAAVAAATSWGTTGGQPLRRSPSEPRSPRPRGPASRGWCAGRPSPSDCRARRVDHPGGPPARRSSGRGSSRPPARSRRYDEGRVGLEGPGGGGQRPRPPRAGRRAGSSGPITGSGHPASLRGCHKAIWARRRTVKVGE